MSLDKNEAYACPVNLNAAYGRLCIHVQPQVSTTHATANRY